MGRVHDAGRTLGADHAAVDRMIGVAFDVTDFTILEMDLDAATAGTHVASGFADLVGDMRRRARRRFARGLCLVG